MFDLCSLFNNTNMRTIVISRVLHYFLLHVDCKIDVLHYFLLHVDCKIDGDLIVQNVRRSFRRSVDRFL